MAIPLWLPFALEAGSQGVGLISNLLGGSRAKKQIKRKEQEYKRAGLVEALTKGKVSPQVAPYEYKDSGAERALNLISGLGSVAGSTLGGWQQYKLADQQAKANEAWTKELQNQQRQEWANAAEDRVRTNNLQDMQAGIAQDEYRQSVLDRLARTPGSLDTPVQADMTMGRPMTSKASDVLPPEAVQNVQYTQSELARLRSEQAADREYETKARNLGLKKIEADIANQTENTASLKLFRERTGQASVDRANAPSARNERAQALLQNGQMAILAALPVVDEYVKNFDKVIANQGGQTGPARNAYDSAFGDSTSQADRGALQGIENIFTGQVGQNLAGTGVLSGVERELMKEGAGQTSGFRTERERQKPRSIQDLMYTRARLWGVDPVTRTIVGPPSSEAWKLLNQNLGLQEVEPSGQMPTADVQTTTPQVLTGQSAIDFLDSQSVTIPPNPVRRGLPISGLRR